MVKRQYFNALHFTLDEKSGYYENSTIHKSMHRYVWEYYNGKIPKGYEIHHIDGDKGNNDISNLECISKKSHLEIHSRNLTPEQREWRRNNLNTKARPKAIEWHKSEEGIEWHRQQVLTRKDNRTKLNCTCQQCGKQFIVFTNNKGKKYCSGACEQKYRRQNGLNNTEAICVICGKEFITDKYSPSKTCSRSCAAKLGHKKKGN